MALDWDRRLLDISVSQPNESGDGEVTANPTSTLVMQNRLLPLQRHDVDALLIAKLLGRVIYAR